MDKFDQNQHSSSAYQKDIVRFLSKFFQEYMVHLFQFALEYDDGAELAHFQQALTDIKNWSVDDAGGDKITQLSEEITTDYPDLCSHIELFFHIREHMMRQSVFGNDVAVQPARHVDCTALFYEMIKEMSTSFEAQTHLFDFTSIDKYAEASKSFKSIQEEIKRAITDVLEQSIRKPNKDELKQRQFEQKSKAKSMPAPAATTSRLQKPHELATKTPIATKKEYSTIKEVNPVKPAEKKQMEAKKTKHPLPQKSKPVTESIWKSSHRKNIGKPVEYEDSSESDEASESDTASDSEASDVEEEEDEEEQEEGEGDDDEEEDADEDEDEGDTDDDDDDDDDDELLPKKE